jgi:hypothetical protein
MPHAHWLSLMEIAARLAHRRRAPGPRPRPAPGPAAKAADPALASDSWGQLYWVYQRSPYFEEGYRRYPVLRVE